ncbi:hypothetical protein ACTXG5_22895 [Mycobacterium sp. Dal123C01]|uniref:hypothetical protein n=1 Tax=Mycobacterium sp. Dal123C01 TaxID=3457577 RepID=UPI00403E8E88
MNEQLALFCRFGHLMMDEGNIRRGRTGEPLCKACLRIHLAAVRQREHRQQVIAERIAEFNEEIEQRRTNE